MSATFRPGPSKLFSSGRMVCHACNGNEFFFGQGSSMGNFDTLIAECSSCLKVYGRAFLLFGFIWDQSEYDQYKEEHEGLLARREERRLARGVAQNDA